MNRNHPVTALKGDKAVIQDLCVISSALDNALEANTRLKSENRYVKLNMKLDRDNLLIIIENSFDGHIKRNRKGEIITVKTEKVNHGIGLDSICKSVDKYHGIVKTSITEQVFVLEILLYKE